MLRDAEKRERNEKPTTVVPLLGYEQMNKSDAMGADEDYDMMIWSMEMLTGSKGMGGGREGAMVVAFATYLKTV